MQTQIIIAFTLVLSCSVLNAGETQTAKLTISVNFGAVNSVSELHAPHDSLPIETIPSIAVVRVWTKESVNLELGLSEPAPQKPKLKEIDFKNTAPHNFGIVQSGQPFVIKFNEPDNHSAFISTLASNDIHTRRNETAMKQVGFHCNLKGGIHRVGCTNHADESLGFIMAVSGFEEEYDWFLAPGEYKCQPGRVDVSLLLDETWHPCRYRGFLRRGDNLRLHFTICDKNP